MSGLVKQKQYDWKDSNIALVGSDTDRGVKKEAAKTEEAWRGAGQKVGLQIWRIEKFKVVHWDKDRYGEFYDGDSYIILNTYKEDPENEKLLYDVHFWIGKHSTKDEYGTAAYKTVELDTLLDDVPVQHREVQNHESELFKKYFKSIRLFKGGCDSGFKHVEPEKYERRLLKVRAEKKNITVTEVPCCKDSVHEGDIYILDEGLTLTQFNSAGAAYSEVRKASEVVADIKNKRHGKAVSDVLDKEDVDQFKDKLGDVKPDSDDEDDDEEVENEPGKLFRLSDASGEIEFEMVKEDGGIRKRDFDSNDVFIAHVGKEVFVWVGKKSSEKEKANGLAYAERYLQKHSRTQLEHVCVIKEGQKCTGFDVAITA